MLNTFKRPRAIKYDFIISPFRTSAVTRTSWRLLINNKWSDDLGVTFCGISSISRTSLNPSLYDVSGFGLRRFLKQVLWLLPQSAASRDRWHWNCGAGDYLWNPQKDLSTEVGRSVSSLVWVGVSLPGDDEPTAPSQHRLLQSCGRPARQWVFLRVTASRKLLGN